MSCGSCYTNPCSSCNPCKKNDCGCDNFILDWVPHTSCTISLTDGECSATLDLCPGIKKCQTNTHIDFNDQTGCIEYQNEKYIYSDGTDGTIEQICVSEFLPFINLTELNDVDFDDTLDGSCYELIYMKDLSCGDGCKSKEDGWVNWNLHSEGALADSIEYIRGATSDGCPVYLDKPATNCTFLVFSPDCDNPSGEWEYYTIPDTTEDCVLEPNERGYYEVLAKDDCGCPIECQLPVMPPGATGLNYVRDSVPDDPDFPWYYGSYNETINLYLEKNAPNFFGKYDLKVTVNYGIQALKGSKFSYNYNFRSIMAPVVAGESEYTAMQYAGSILQGFAMTSLNATAAGSITGGIPWGSCSLRGGFTFIVPKGKEAYLHHEYRIITNDSVTAYVAGTQSNVYLALSADGQIVPDENLTALDQILYPASRLNALNILIEPINGGTTNYSPTKDADKTQLDSPTDVFPSPY